MMDDYISQDTAIELIRKVSDAMGFETPANAIECVLQIIRRIPAADVRPVVRAEWEYDGVEGTVESPQIRNYCSACEMVVKDAETQGFLLCPFCGAEMKGGQDNVQRSR